MSGKNSWANTPAKSTYTEGIHRATLIQYSQVVRAAQFLAEGRV
jgi:hypothetical protein